jgi:hypothetical protein
MDITGWDTVVFTCCQPREVYRRILSAVEFRWPFALVEDLGDAKAWMGSASGKTLPDEWLPSQAGHLMFLRDEAMASHMNSVAYAPMSDGDGPFAVLARTRRGVEFRCELLDEREVIGEPPFPKVEPYSAWLCSPELYEITVVTPDDPERHGFSIWTCELVRRACRART